MSFENPTSEVYFCNVPFDNDYTNVMLFESRSAQVSYFQNNYVKHYTNVNIIRKDTAIYIKDDFGAYDTVNYVMYRNPELDSKWWFAFVTNSEYVAKNTTKLTIKTDVWQSYLFDRTLKNCFILRGTVGDDSFGKWLVQEPFDIPFAFDNKIITSMDEDLWKPVWHISTTAWWIVDSGTSSGYSVLYGGVSGDYNAATGSYSFKPLTPLEVTSFIGAFAELKLDNTIQGIYALPDWVSSKCRYGESTGSTYGLILSNDLIQTNFNFDLDFTKLACGYIPENNKMLTSLGKKFKLYNYNGFMMSLLPENFSENVINGKSKPGITLAMQPYQSFSYKLTTHGYLDFAQNCVTIPYSGMLPCGYNSNVGITNALNTLNMFNTGFNAIANSATAMTPRQLTTVAVNAPTQLITSTVNAAIDKPNSIGNGESDNLSLVPKFSAIRLAESSPLYNECAFMDNYLTVYGYAINDNYNLNDWIHNRQIFDYVQTAKDGTSLSIKGNATDENKLKQIFINGVHIWHSMSSFGSFPTHKAGEQSNPIVTK